MPYYDVHIYAIVRVKVACVEADSPQAAAHQTESSVDLHGLVVAGRAEYADDVEGLLVDALDEAGRRIDGQSVFLDPRRGDVPDD
jgi:hypothetical protein